MSENCGTCKWWSVYQNDLGPLIGACGVPLPPLRNAEGDVTEWIRPTRRDYWCVLHRADLSAAIRDAARSDNPK